mgnify:CR=1 FL=1
MDPKNLSAMTLRSGKEVEGPKLVTPKDKNKDWIEKELEEEGTRSTNPEVIPDSITKIRSNLPSFPNRLEKSKSKTKRKRS